LKHKGTKDTKKTVWRGATYAIVVVWIAAMARLFITDVWDETSRLGRLLATRIRARMQLVSMILKTPLPFWRPIPTIFAALTIPRAAAKRGLAGPADRQHVDDPRRLSC